MKLYENKKRFFYYTLLICSFLVLLVLLFFSGIDIDSRHTFFYERIILWLVVFLFFLLFVFLIYHCFLWNNSVYFMCDERKILISWKYPWQLQYHSRSEIEKIEMTWWRIIITFFEEKRLPYAVFSPAENRRKTWNYERTFSEWYNNAVIRNHPKEIFIEEKYIKWTQKLEDIYLAIHLFFQNFNSNQ